MKLAPGLHAWRYTGKRCGRDWLFAKTMHAYIWRCGDVMTFESLTLTPFCFEKSSVRKGIFNVSATFSARCVLKSGKICKNIEHTSEDVWTLGLTASCSNSFLGTRQMLMHEKTCVIPIVTSAWLNFSLNKLHYAYKWQYSTKNIFRSKIWTKYYPFHNQVP